MYTVQLSQLRVTMLPPERLEAEASTSGARPRAFFRMSR